MCWECWDAQKKKKEKKALPLCGRTFYFFNLKEIQTSVDSVSASTKGEVWGVGVSVNHRSVSLSSPALCFSSSTHCTHAHISKEKKAPHSFSKSRDDGQGVGCRWWWEFGLGWGGIIYCLTHQCVIDRSGLEPESVYTEEVTTMCCVRLICNYHQSVRGL